MGTMQRGAGAGGGRRGRCHDRARAARPASGGHRRSLSRHVPREAPVVARLLPAGSCVGAPSSRRSVGGGPELGSWSPPGAAPRSPRRGSAAAEGSASASPETGFQSPFALRDLGKAADGLGGFLGPRWHLGDLSSSSLKPSPRFKSLAQCLPVVERWWSLCRQSTCRGHCPWPPLPPWVLTSSSGLTAAGRCPRPPEASVCASCTSEARCSGPPPRSHPPEGRLGGACGHPGLSLPAARELSSLGPSVSRQDVAWPSVSSATQPYRSLPAPSPRFRFPACASRARAPNTLLSPQSLPQGSCLKNQREKCQHEGQNIQPGTRGSGKARDRVTLLNPRVTLSTRRVIGLDRK